MSKLCHKFLHIGVCCVECVRCMMRVLCEPSDVCAGCGDCVITSDVRREERERGFGAITEEGRGGMDGRTEDGWMVEKKEEANDGGIERAHFLSCACHYLSNSWSYLISFWQSLLIKNRMATHTHPLARRTSPKSRFETDTDRCGGYRFSWHLLINRVIPCTIKVSQNWRVIQYRRNYRIFFIWAIFGIGPIWHVAHVAIPSATINPLTTVFEGMYSWATTLKIFL